MKKFYWRIRYVYWMRRFSGASFKLCWQTAVASEDEGHPKDAVISEMGYWVD